MGRSGMKVSSFGLGTMVLGGWGNIDHRACERIIHRCLEAGINLIDTADMYAAGESEEIVEMCWTADRRSVAGPHSEQPLYSILSRAIEADVLPTCRRHGIGVLTWSPLAGGWLTGKYQRASTAPPDSRAVTNPDHFDTDNAAKYEAVEQLRVIADQSGLTIVQLALAFAREHPAVNSVLLGPRTEAQLDDLLGAVGIELDADTLNAIDGVVPPGSDLRPADRQWVAPSLATNERRRCR